MNARAAAGTGRWVRKRCPTCAESLVPGHLWMGGRDYVECPDCEGTAVFKFFEERTQPPPTRVFLVHYKGA